MKKLLTLALIAVTAMTTFTACKKDNGGKGDDKSFKQTARMISMSAIYGDEAETWTYKYNKDGKVAEVIADWAGEPYSDFVFTYSGNTCKVTDGDKIEMDITLNSQGLAEKIVWYDKETKTFELTYTKDGFLSSVKINGAKATDQEINGEECVEFWTRLNKDSGEWRKKMHTFDNKKENCGAVHTEWAEDAGLKRWFYESGLVGRASRYVCATAQWFDRTALAQYDYEYDVTGAIKKETKSYGEPGALEFDCEFTFTWQAIN